MPFDIKTGRPIIQGDGLSALLFNCVLETVAEIWHLELKIHHT